MDDFEDFTPPPEPPKVTLLSDIKGDVDSSKKRRPAKKTARPRPVGKNPEKDRDDRKARSVEFDVPGKKSKGFKKGSGFSSTQSGFGPPKSGSSFGKPKSGSSFGQPKSGSTFGQSKSGLGSKPASNDYQTRAPRKAKEPTAQRLKNVAEYQLQQREMSTGSLRDLLSRRMIKFLMTLERDEASEKRIEIEANIEAVIELFVKNGFIDDQRYAEMKIRSWRNQGRGLRRIEMDLTQKGISPEIQQFALREVDMENIDIEDDNTREQEAEHVAADTLAKKRKIGSYRLTPMPEDFVSSQKVWRREAGILARAGFGMDIIHEILSRPPEGPDDF